MNLPSRAQFKALLAGFFASSGRDREVEAGRVIRIERDVILPVRGAALLAITYFFFAARWFDVASTPREEAVVRIIGMFVAYALVQITYAAVLFKWTRPSPRVVEWGVFVTGLLDGVMLAALTITTGGFGSILFWLFLILIVHHTVCIPAAAPQIGVNLLCTLFYLVAGLVDLSLVQLEATALGAEKILLPEMSYSEISTDPLILRIAVLLLTTACCFGVQALVVRQRKIQEEAQEFAVRQEQLSTAGRISAEIAHRLKNPLSIITNAAFVLQRQMKDAPAQAQLRIIREEVDRSDQILTELMGYARLSEGRVERLSVAEELDSAIEQVFPPAAKFEVEVRRSYAPDLPSLLMQRGQFSEIFVNLLQNAREAMQGKGMVEVVAQHGPGHSVVVTVTDTGPGISPEKFHQVFESYYTTKEKGSGLGLAIVKHNTEIYGGTVQLDSDLGRGACFTLQFPARTLLSTTQ